jgi:hypothetical protein
MLIDGTDLDDGHRMARGHPGAAIIPAALAAAQEAGSTTEQLLQAIAVGYEVGVAVGAARRFYANTGMWSGYGVVAALGFLRHTPREQLAHAFAIAGISAPNQLHAGAGPAFRAQEGSDIKEGISMVERDGGQLRAEGDGRLERLRYRTADGRESEVAAEVLLVHEGVVPNIHAPLALGCAVTWHAAQHCYVPVLDA